MKAEEAGGNDPEEDDEKSPARKGKAVAGSKSGGATAMPAKMKSPRGK